jgi:NADPH:quinone reductase-like Zn-dependent oxidoreductase
MDSSCQATNPGWCTPQTDGPYDEIKETNNSPNPEGWWSKVKSPSNEEAANADGERGPETREEDPEDLVPERHQEECDDLELTDSQVDLQLTESQILRMLRTKKVSFACAATEQGDNRRDTETCTSILGLLKEHTCNYELDSPTYTRFAQHFDRKIEQLDKSIFGPIPSQEDTFYDTDDDGVISPRSNGPTSPASPASASFASMYEDLQEEIATRRQKKDNRRSTTASPKAKTIFQRLSPKSPKSAKRPTPMNADDVLEDDFTSRINDRSTLIARKEATMSVEGPLNDDVVLKDNFTNRINKRSTRIVTKEPVMCEEGFEQEITFEREVEENNYEQGVEVINAEQEREVEEKEKTDESVGMETAASTKDRPPDIVVLNGSSSFSIDSFNLKNMSSMSEDGMPDPSSRRFQDLSGEQSKTCVPPLFQKKLKMYGQLLLKKSMSTQTTAKMTAESYPTMRMASTRGSGSVADQESTCYIYEYGSDKNAYIAYFRRADEKARSSVRLYEHPIPPVFSTLSSEVVIKIEASSVSATDCAVRRGSYWGEGSSKALSLPIVPGVTFAGRIIQGDKLRRSGLNIGDRVISLVRVGANSRHLCISRDRLVKVPAEISDPASACCLPELYLAAFQALHLNQSNSSRYRKSALSGKSILILGGDTAHGLAAIELAVAAGATIVYGAGKINHFGKIKAVGGFPVDRDPREWFAMAEGKLDLIIGSNNDDQGRSELKYEHIRMLNESGQLVILTVPDQGDKGVIDLDKLDGRLHATKRKMLHHSVFDAWETDLRQGRRDLAHLLKLLENGSIKPKVLERIPLTKVAKAQDMMENRNLRGFIVCEPWIKSAKRGSAFPGTDFYSESLNQSNSTESLKGRKQQVTSLSFNHSLLHSGSGSVQSSKNNVSYNGPMANDSAPEGSLPEGSLNPSKGPLPEESLNPSKGPLPEGSLNPSKSAWTIGQQQRSRMVFSDTGNRTVFSDTDFYSEG